MRLCIVIPTLNESQGIGATLEALQSLRSRGVCLLLADGGSCDDTVTQAAAHCDAVVAAPRGRARQMNAGAAACPSTAQAQAPSDEPAVLLFLHADTRLPDTAYDDIRDAVAAGAQWGRFDVRLSGRYTTLRWVEFLMNWRSRLTGIATGDQCIFARADFFARCGGFADIALMEDIEFSRRAKRLAPPACLRSRVITSSRRWEAHGIWRTILLMNRLRLAFFFGADPAKLAQRYARS